MLWLSAQDIADAASAGLMPGLPTVERSVRRLAAASGWAESGLARVREGRSGGGGLEYHVDLLPMAARVAWISSKLVIEASDLRPVLTDAAPCPAREARQVILRIAARFQTQNAMSQTAADAMFCEVFAGGSIDLPAWVKDEISSLSPRTLARWRSGDVKGATGRGGRPKGSGILDRAEGGAVRELILAAIASQPFLSAKHLRILVKDRFGARLSIIDEQTGELREVPLPSIRMFQIALKGWKVEYRNEMMRLTDPDGYRSKIEFTATGSQKANRLNEVWQIDASPADVMLTTGRHSIYMAIDVYSRRTVVLATPTPRASAVGLLIRKCLIAWGVPERIHTDNGSDFVARQTKRLFDALGVEVELSPPYNPKSKGIVERTIGTFQRDLATCPGFIGHSVADRKVIESRKAFARRLGASDVELFNVEMDIAAFQSWCDSWSSEIYGHDSHAGLGGRTPFEVAASYAGSVRRIEHIAALDVLLAPIASGDGIRTVGKQGVRVDNAHYLPMGVMPGTDVLVRMDPADLGRVMLFDPETEAFLSEAICAELAGLNPAEVTAKAKAMQQAFERDRLTDIRHQMRRLKPSDVADAMRREAHERAQVVTAFPKRSEAHSTAAIEAASEAAGQHRTQAKPSAVDPAAREAFVAQFAAHAPKPSRERPIERFRRAIDLEGREAAGEALNAADVAWLQVYQTQPEYRAHRLMFEERGQAMFA